MSSFIMTLSLFKAPSSGGAFPFQRPAEIFGLPPFAMYAVYPCLADKIVSYVIIAWRLAKNICWQDRRRQRLRIDNMTVKAYFQE